MRIKLEANLREFYWDFSLLQVFGVGVIISWPLVDSRLWVGGRCVFLNNVRFGGWGVLRWKNDTLLEVWQQFFARKNTCYLGVITLKSRSLVISKIFFLPIFTSTPWGKPIWESKHHLCHQIEFHQNPVSMWLIIMASKSPKAFLLFMAYKWGY